MSDYLCGFGIGDITVFEPGLIMLGWGDHRQICEGVAMPLKARAWVVEGREEPRGRIVYVCCDLGFISESVRNAVGSELESLGIRGEELMLTATHTHSGPSGFSTYLFYALTAPGISARVHRTIVKGVVDAVKAALAAMRPARIFMQSGWIPASEPISFNRSLEAYNKNVDVSPLSAERADEAVDRTMTVLRVEDSVFHAPMGMIAWFPVHGTSLHSDFRRLHGDNKGEAAAQTEAWAREAGFPHFVAIFPQEATGDVSPNYRMDRRRGVLIGRYDDDLESAAFNGAVQSRHARILFTLAREEGEELDGSLSSSLIFRDFYDLPVERRFATEERARTGPPQVGLAFALGTREGKGPLSSLRSLAPLLRRLGEFSGRSEPSWSWRAPQGSKLPLVDLGPVRDNRAFGRLPLLVLYPFLDKRSVDYFDRSLAQVGQASWVPRHLPIQQLRIGSLVIAGLPVEPTTVCGRRIRESLQSAWGPGARRIIVNGYANAYCGYLTTPEEYEVQAYEGAATFYGKHSLAAFMGELTSQAEAMRARRKTPPSVPPPPVALDVFSPRSGY